MERKLDKPLWAAAASTFEHLGFLLAEPEPPSGEAGSVPGGGLAAEGAAAPEGWVRDAPGFTVSFRGPVAGHLLLQVSPDVARDVASTMLATPDDASPELVADTLGELSNVICGNVLPHLVGPDAEFALQPPVPWQGAAAEPGAPRAEARMRVGPGRARVCLFLDGAEGAVDP